MSNISLVVDCPCFSGKAYKDCCQPCHDGLLASDALTLMRSRYAAYALGLVDYIMNTTHPLHPSYTKNRKKWRTDLLAFVQGTQFVGLDILQFVDGDRHASVTFCAHLRQNEVDASFIEESKFVKEDGKWLYLAGMHR